jgi:electron transfer flavoprotein alpha subunit
MTQALFVYQNAGEPRAEELASLGALAAIASAAGLQPQLLVIDLDDAAKAPGIPDAFGLIRRIVSPGGSGDGASLIDAVLSSAVGNTNPALVVTFSNLSSRNWAARFAASLSATFLPACDSLTQQDGRLVAGEPVMGGMMRRQVGLGEGSMVLLYAGQSLAFTGGVTPLAVEVETAAVPETMRLVRRSPLPDTGGIPLKGASRIVSGGLGVGSVENWSKIDAFAARVGAAVGASRAAVDMGWVPSSRQVGFSGQKVAPDVYVAIGISGAVHHLAGIAGARKVVAINKDPEAPIFQIADVAIIGDYQVILDAAHKKLDQA